MMEVLMNAMAREAGKDNTAYLSICGLTARSQSPLKFRHLSVSPETHGPYRRT